MRKTTISRFILTLLLVITLSFGSGIRSYAATDDPGAGRLSGKDIPKEFYENEDPECDGLLKSPVGTSSVSPYTGLTYTHPERVSNRTMINGIDVSQWQQTIDWKKVKAAGIDFALIRVGYRGYGSGALDESTKDGYYDANMEGAIKAGIKVGVYVFSQAITVDEAIEEADYILNHLGNYEISMPLIMDYEYASGSSDGGRLKTANLTKEQATEICKAFCDRIALSGYTPMVYANKSMLENQVNADEITNAGYRIWLANYTTSTAYAGEFDFWQYSSSGAVDGIAGNVDMNFYYKQSSDNFTGVTPPKRMKAVKSKMRGFDYIKIKWDALPDADGYEIFRSDCKTDNYFKIKNINNPETVTYKDINLEEGEYYFYKIRAFVKKNDRKYYGSFSPITTLYTKTEYPRSAVVKTKTKIYSDISTSSKAVTTVAVNEIMDIGQSVYDANDKKWFEVTFKKNGKTKSGYVKSNKIYVTTTGELTCKRKITLYAASSTDSGKVTTMSQGSTVYILKTKSVNKVKWYQVIGFKKGVKYTGWVCSPYIKC